MFFSFIRTPLKIDFSSFLLQDVKCGWDRRDCRLIIFLVVYNSTFETNSVGGSESTLGEWKLKHFGNYVSSSCHLTTKGKPAGGFVYETHQKIIKFDGPAASSSPSFRFIVSLAEEYNFNLNKWNLCFQARRRRRKMVTFSKLSSCNADVMTSFRGVIESAWDEISLQTSWGFQSVTLLGLCPQMKIYNIFLLFVNAFSASEATGANGDL